MHQPLYKDLSTGKCHLPWVRLHSTHSYLDMARILDDFPKIRCTFNLTPTLISQLMDIPAAADENDVYLELSIKDAGDLTADEKYFILKNFFSCDYAAAISPMKKYKELFLKRGPSPDGKFSREILSKFSVSDIRDIQVFFNLAWCGFTLKKGDSLVRALVEKGGGYDERDKRDLLARQKEIAASILPEYKKLQDSGRIEISTTPFYHPILPILCGEKGKGDLHWEADAMWHIKKAIELYSKVFGRKPEGMWPAEGSVSDNVVPLFAGCGIKWIATDEKVLASSLKDRGDAKVVNKFRAFTAGKFSRKISIVFRDNGLSDDISFKYSHMSGKEAAREFHGHLTEIYKFLGNKCKDGLVAVILDGENPWAHYPDDGKSFLSELYRLLSEDKDMETVTIGGYLGEHKKRLKIKHLASGSWIDHDFSKWRGSPQKDKAWEYLKKAREDMFSSGNTAENALEELYIAESSDWFWWYDEFGTELNFIFDDLFRMHLKNMYRLTGRDVPDHLNKPVAGSKFDPRVR